MFRLMDGTSWQAANNTANPQGTCIHSTLQCSSLTPFSNGLLRISAVTSWYSLNHGNSTEKPVCIPSVQQCNAKRITACHDSAMLARVACTMNQVNVIYFRYRWRPEANKLSVWRILIHTEEKKKQSGQQVELLPGTPEKDYFDLKSVLKKTRDGSSLWNDGCMC